MNKTYQPIVLTLCDKFTDNLTESGFFAENEIENIEPAKIILCDFLTEKFINGYINIDGSVTINDDEEFMGVLSMIVASSTLDSLKEKGMLDSFEDETGEDMFFLTKKGKEIGKKL